MIGFAKKSQVIPPLDHRKNVIWKTTLYSAYLVCGKEINFENSLNYFHHCIVVIKNQLLDLFFWHILHHIFIFYIVEIKVQG